MRRGVSAVARSPLSEEVKAELSRLALKVCDARVLAALLPRAAHLGVPARRLAHVAEGAVAGPLLRRACCRRTYLRGLFLAGGSLSTGRSGNLLEIRPPPGETGRARAVLAREGLVVHERVRRGCIVLTLRNADEIAGFLRAVGATETLLRFETKRVSREVRARTNALVNADSANLARTVAAAHAQVQAVRAIAERSGLRGLPEPLAAVARARLRSPAASLSELAVRLGTTKWVVRGRLRNILEVARA